MKFKITITIEWLGYKMDSTTLKSHVKRMLDKWSGAIRILKVDVEEITK